MIATIMFLAMPAFSTFVSLGTSSAYSTSQSALVEISPFHTTHHLLVSCNPNPDLIGQLTTCTVTDKRGKTGDTIMFSASPTLSGTFIPANGECSLSSSLTCSVSFLPSDTGKIRILAIATVEEQFGFTILKVEHAIPTPVFPVGSVLGLLVPLAAIGVYGFFRKRQSIVN